MTRIDRRWFGEDRPGWPAFLLGAATGLAAGLVLRGRPRRNEDEGSAGRARGWSRLRDAWDDAVEGASEGLASARQMVASDPELDEAALREILGEMSGSSGCRLRVLSDGIVELVGSCPSETVLADILAVLAAAPGVEVVVNRVWTPDSSGPGAPSGDVPAH